jgi:2-methylcitrate dehydratase PrpD
VSRSALERDLRPESGPGVGPAADPVEPTPALASFVSRLRPEALPAAVLPRVRSLVLDLFGIGIRARRDAESSEPLVEAVRALGLAPGPAHVLGDPDGFTHAGAALLNGALAHSLDFDDTHARASLHPSAPVVPAALAAAELLGAPGSTLLAGVVAGYEVAIRLSLALGPRDHYDRGFHPTATCGAFGAAAAAGRVLGLAPAAQEHAFGIALSQAAGTMQYLENGAWTKRFQVGWAAHAGLVAAVCASRGVIGAARALEGRRGLLRAYAPASDAGRLCDGLGERFETLEIAWKPYPCCRYAHAAMDALAELRAEHALRAEQVERVEVGLPRAGYDLIADPPERTQAPRSVVDAQFSMPFLAAVALRQGTMGWDDHAGHLRDPATLALARRVTCTVDPRAEAEFPAQMSASVRVRTARASLERFVRVPRGEPERFPSEAELRAKFHALAVPCLGESRCDALAGAIAMLGSAREVGSLLDLARPGGDPGA